MNINSSSNILVKVKQTSNKGQGVFSVGNFKKDETVIVGKPVYKLQERDWQSLQTDVNTHVRMDAPFELVNHSCDPNCGVKANEFGGYNLVAMRDIYAEEEITMDYCMCEWISIAVKNCGCNTALCRKTIKGGKYLPPEILNKYKGYIAPFYQKLC